MYDDVEEITSKSDTRFIDDVYLSDEEIAQIPECLYEREIGRLWLNQGVNKLHLPLLSSTSIVFLMKSICLR